MARLAENSIPDGRLYAYFKSQRAGLVAMFYVYRFVDRAPEFIYAFHCSGGRSSASFKGCFLFALFSLWILLLVVLLSAACFFGKIHLAWASAW